MKKKIQNLTLKEIIMICEKSPVCDQCPFHTKLALTKNTSTKKACLLNNDKPYMWDAYDRKEFVEQEVEVYE